MSPPPVHLPPETTAELLLRLGSREGGLASGEARARLARLGPNAAPPPRLHTRLGELLRAAGNPLTLILLIASAASAFLGQLVSAAIIAAIVALSAALNLLQTMRSTRAVAQLQARVAATATVRRDGAWCELPRRDLVVGDVIQLSAGDLVPADARLLSSVDLHVLQAALTGESFPAEKAVRERGGAAAGPDAPELVFAGTSVASGTASAIVFATGSATAFGDIVARLAARPDETEFERGTRQFGALILQTVLFLVLFIVIVNISLQRDPLQSVLFAVALAVGLTPEFLPMITTVTLAQGAVRMARGKVIVKHLSAIQNLGSIDILCSDKTGTLTAGTMSLADAVDARGLPAPRALAAARLNSHFQTGLKSPLDAAIMQGAPAPTADRKTDEIPFDFERRRLSVVLELAGRFRMITKGAPEGVLAVCEQVLLDGQARPLDPALRAACIEVYRAAGRRGQRVLAVAERELPGPAGHAVADERGMTLLGFLSFEDHLLDGAAATLERLRQDGVQVKILTGDDELVTRHLCAEVGLDATRIVLGAEVEQMLDTALMRVAEEVHVFARISPAQKHRIIRALKSAGHVVGFLGDGINDAPSLHGADVGISVAGAADIAREASDIVLLEHRLEVLHAGILAGRRSFANVLKYLLMGTSSNFGNMFSMAGAALVLPFLPMLPTQILLNNFLYDLAQITIPTDNVDAAYVERPQRWDVRLIRRFMLTLGPVSSLYDFLTFFVLYSVLGFAEPRFHTGWFVESLVTQTLVLFVIRTAGRPWRSRPSLPLTLTTLFVVAVGIVLPYSPLAGPLGLAPLPVRYFGFLLIASSSYLVVVELVKRRVLRRFLPPLGAQVVRSPGPVARSLRRP